MPIGSRDADARPASSRGVRGRVPMRMELVIRFDYGSIVPWVRARRRRDLGDRRARHAPAPRATSRLRGEDLTTVADFTVAEGQRVAVRRWPGTRRTEPPPPGARRGSGARRETERWWRDWSGRCTYQGE